MTEVSNMPDRPIYLHEVNLIETENDEVKNAEALFYRKNNINSAICVFVNISDTAYIVGYDVDEGTWKVLTTTSDDDSTIGSYKEDSSNVIQWVNDMYGEDGYGIYEMFGS